MAYQRPMVTVDQNMTVAPTSIERDQPAFIFGPNYELYRYEYADEKKKTQIQSYTGEEFVAEYPAAIDPEAVDNSFTKLFGDNVVVKLADLGDVTLAEKNLNTSGGATEAELTSEKGGYSRLFFNGKVYVDRDAKGKRYELDRNLVKNIAVGDQLIVNYEKDGAEASIRTTVTSAQYSTEGFDLTTKFTGLEITGNGTLIEIDDAIPTGSEVSDVSVSLVDVLNGVEFDRKTGSDGKYYWNTDDDGFDVPETITFGTPVTVGSATYAGNKLTFTETLGTTLAEGDTVKLSYDVTVAGEDGGSPSKVTKDVTATVVSVNEKVVTVEFAEGTNTSTVPSDVDVLKTATTSSKKKYGVKVFAGLKAADVAYSSDYETLYDVLSADLFVSHRELLTTYADTLHSLVGASSVSNMLGKVDPDNPLAMGVYMAALNSATDDGDEAPAVYYMATPTDDVDGYTAVLNKASLTDKVYVLAPTTRDEAVIELVRNHALEMSAKTVKQWRIAAVSAEIPDTVCRLDSSMDVNGDHFYAIPVSSAGIKPNNGSSYKMFRIVKDSSSSDGNTDTKLRSTVVKGDTVKFAFRTDSYGELKSDTYTVKRVINNYTIEVEESIDVTELNDTDKDSDGKETPSGFYAPEQIEIYHTYTSAEHAEVIASTSSALASRRVMNVFPSVFKMDGVQMTGEFAACAVAGLVSATEPQQPITNVTVRGIDDIPLVYQTYNNTELDTIAAGGTFIVTQDLPGDTVYVRHQITTAYPDGNLNTAELSITKNVDSISYAFADLFKPYYGKYNITDELLLIFENLAGQLINQFGSSTSVYGPQLITDETKINYVKQNELMKDHVDISITLGVPYPCNNIDIVLTV